MNLRPFDAAVGDAVRLSQFRCSTGAPFEDEVEAWIRTDAVAWVNDLPRAQFQRRTLGLIVDGVELTAVVAWQDITRVDLEGIWLEVLAVALDHQQYAGPGWRDPSVTQRSGIRGAAAIRHGTRSTA